MGARIVVAGVCMETDRIEPLVFIGKEIELRFVLGYSPGGIRRQPAPPGGRHDALRRRDHRRGGAGRDAAAFRRLQTDKSQIKILVKPGG